MIQQEEPPVMGQVINGPWKTSPARINPALIALPEPEYEQVYMMLRVLQRRPANNQEKESGS